MRKIYTAWGSHNFHKISSQEMLYGIQTGFGSPQVPVAELLARPAPTLLSPQNYRPKSSNFLQVPDIESRPKSVPSSPMVKRAFSRLGTITAGWGRSIRSKQSQLNVEDKKKWASSQDCSGKMSFIMCIINSGIIKFLHQTRTARIEHPKIRLMHLQQCLVSSRIRVKIQLSITTSRPQVYQFVPTLKRSTEPS